MHTLRSSRSVLPCLAKEYPSFKTYLPKETEAKKVINSDPWAIATKYRNIDLFSIGYAVWPDLRTD
jgi:hypothetical protein